MASQKTLDLKRDNMLRRLLAIGEITQAPHSGPNHAARRKQLQNWARINKIPYTEARQIIRDEEAKMRRAGIDPWAPKTHLIEPKNESENTKVDSPHVEPVRESGGDGEDHSEGLEPGAQTEAGSGEGRVGGTPGANSV